MTDFSNQVQVQMQSYQHRIAILEKQLNIWKSLQCAILEQRIKLVDNHGATMAYDGKCEFDIIDSKGSELLVTGDWNEALDKMGVL